MPHRASAKKRLRQNEKRRLRNRAVKSRLRTETRKFERALERGDVEEARAQLNLITKLLHRAGARGILHPNTASRRQSKLQQRLNSMATGAAQGA